MLKTSKFNTSMRSNSMKRHCKSLLPSSSQNFEPCKPDNAILQYLNQHVRQLGLDAPSFTNQKEKSNNSDKSERHKSSSSNKRKHRTDRSDKKRKRTDVSDFKSKFIDYKSKSRESFHDKKRDRYPVVGPLVGPLVDPLVGPLV
jgi:hypothetical protein